MADRRIVCADAMKWLKDNRPEAIVTSPPDAEEIGADLADWSRFFSDALVACLKASAGPVVFYVTDRKADGGTRSKLALIFDAMRETGAALTWHKIALRRAVGKVDLHRPGFSHLVAINGRPGAATPDVFDRGRALYPNGTGLIAARVAVEWIKAQGVESLADPFCGVGTIPAVASALGIASTGVDIDAGQCRKAGQIRLSAG